MLRLLARQFRIGKEDFRPLPCQPASVKVMTGEATGILRQEIPGQQICLEHQLPWRFAG